MIVIGIDGGGTNTRACLMDKEGTVLAIGKSGSSSIDTVTPEETLNSIRIAITEGFKMANLTPQSISSIFVGLGGVLTEASKRMVKHLLYKLPTISSETIIQVENDTYSAFLGGLANRPGIALIVGTGSVAFGIDEKGNSHRAGGFGYKKGDHGSSYHLGRRAIQFIARVFDGRMPQDDFSDALYKKLKINIVDDLLAVIQDMHHNRTKVAALAPLVTTYANWGSATAREICDEGVMALTSCVEAVCTNLELENKEIAIIGGLGNSVGYYNEQLYKQLFQIDANFNIHPSLSEPVIGSARKALENTLR